MLIMHSFIFWSDNIILIKEIVINFVIVLFESLDNLLNEMDKWSFHKLNQFHDKWFIIFHQKYDCQITLFTVFT